MDVRIGSELATEAAELVWAAANEWQQAKKEFVADEGEFLDEHIERATGAASRLEAHAADGEDPTGPESARRCVERLLSDIEAFKAGLLEAADYLGEGRVYEGERDAEEVAVAVLGISDGITEVRDALQTHYGDCEN